MFQIKKEKRLQLQLIAKEAARNNVTQILGVTILMLFVNSKKNIDH